MTCERSSFAASSLEVSLFAVLPEGDVGFLYLGQWQVGGCVPASHSSLLRASSVPGHISGFTGLRSVPVAILGIRTTDKLVNTLQFRMRSHNLVHTAV